VKFYYILFYNKKFESKSEVSSYSSASCAAPRNPQQLLFHKMLFVTSRKLKASFRLFYIFRLFQVIFGELYGSFPETAKMRGVRRNELPRGFMLA